MGITMKRFYIIAALLFIFSSVTAAQQHFHMAAVRLGMFNPKAADAGFIIGYEGGVMVDEIFSFGWSADWFHTEYTDKQLVSQFNDAYGGVIDETINELRARTVLNSFPLMVNITGGNPIAPKTRFFFRGAIGAEVLIISYRDFQNPDESDLKGAFDLSWEAAAGIAYEIGSRSDIFAEISYHSSKPSWEYEVNDGSSPNPRIFERSYDMTGVMLRGGVRFFFR